MFLPQRLRCLDAQGAAVGEKPAAQGEAAGQDPGRQVDLQRMGMAVADRVGRQHPRQGRMHPVRCGALGCSRELRLLGRPFKPDLIEGEGKLPLANGGVGLALAGAAQGLQLAAPLLSAGLAEPVLGLEVIAQLDAAAVMQQPLQAADRQLVLAGVAAAAGLGLEEHQPLQPLALQQPMEPADRIGLPAQMPQPTGEHQLQRPHADLFPFPLIGGCALAQQQHAAVLKDRCLDLFGLARFRQRAPLQALHTGMGAIKNGAQRRRGRHRDAAPGQAFLQLTQ